MKATPRTNAFAKALAEKMDNGYDDEWYDWMEYARQLERELAALPEGRDTVVEECAKVCQKIADECDARADADQADTRSHFWGGGARQCQHAIRALLHRPQAQP